jgi:PAS domain S-box-containing protein
MSRLWRSPRVAGYYSLMVRSRRTVRPPAPGRRGTTGRRAQLVVYAGILVWLAASGWLAWSVYEGARGDTARQLSDLQLTLASQAARGISDHLERIQGDLALLAQDEQVAAVSAAGRRALRRYFDGGRGEFQSVTRMGADGTILFTWPNTASIGSSIRGQPHVERLIATRQPVLSDVFTAVQGYHSIALHVPVVQDGTFRGSVAVLIPVDWIAERFVAGLRVAPAGSAWVVTRHGVRIYGISDASAMVPRQEAQSAEERALWRSMAQGDRGLVRLSRDPLTRAPGGVQVIYLPIPLADSHWSIAVAVPESEIVSMMSGFLRPWLLALLLVVAGVGALLTLSSRLAVAAERRRTAEEVEARYRAMVEDLPAIHYVIDAAPPNRTVYISPQVRHILGFTPEQWIADPDLWLRQVHPEDRGRVEEAIRRNDRRKEPTELEYRVLTADGRERWIHNRCVFSRVGRELTITGVMLDVTERRGAEEALREREEQLTQARKLEAVGRLAGGVAHDFNNLLTVINGYADLLLSEAGLTGAPRVQAREILEAGQRAQRLTDQLLAYSRKQIHSPQVLDLAGRVRQMQSMLRRLIGEHIELVSELAAEPALVRIDPGQLEQVIMNLCVNARDSMSDGGTLRISVSRVTLDRAPGPERPGLRPGAWVVLEVKDTGVGMDAETISHIFEPFFTTKEKGRGTGLGLSTVYGIVAQAGGQVFVRSEPGSGAAFEVFLPRAEADTAAGAAGDGPGADRAATTHPHATSAPPHGEGTAPASSTDLVILLAEDERRVRDLAASILRGAGYTVLEAGSGAEALEVHARAPRPVDLLLTDVIMPGMGGAELARRLAAAHPSLSVIYFTGYAGEELGAQGELADGINLVQKPFSPADLLAMVERVRTAAGKA